MSQVRIKVDDAARLFYNTKLFQVGKDTEAATLSVVADKMLISISDRHTYLTDRATLSYSDTTSKECFAIYLPSDAVKDIELNSRTWQEETTYIDLTPYPLKFEIFETQYPVLMATPTLLDQMLDNQLFIRGGDHPLAINPDRFRKLSLIKPGDYPIDMQHGLHEKFGEIIRFKAGPTVRGAMATLDREVLAKKAGSADFLW